MRALMNELMKYMNAIKMSQLPGSKDIHKCGGKLCRDVGSCRVYRNLSVPKVT